MGYGSLYVLSEGLEPGATHTETFKLYIGDTQLSHIKQIDDDLAGLVDFGWLAFFSKPLHWLLVFFYGFVGNWVWRSSA